MRSQPTSGFTSSGGVVRPRPDSEPSPASEATKVWRYSSIAVFSAASVSSDMSPVLRIASREIDELFAAYTDFRSAFTLRATRKRFLPIAPEEVTGTGVGVVAPEYLFEPGPEQILDHLLPQYVITKVYAALLESAASENAARRRAMKAATENAEDIIKILTRQANRARQDEITTEISEIVGGAEALSSAAGE